MKQPVQLLASVLKKKALTISIAESMTCGLISHKLGTISGTSDIFKGSIVCYNEAVKIGVLKVRKSLIDTYSAESQQVTDQLVVNLKKLMPADICAAVTGLASPGGSEKKSKPVGTVYFSITYRKKLYRAKKKFNGSPLSIRKKAMNFIFRFIIKNIKNNS